MPTAPRSRYAAVVTTAMVGAGVVALGASVGLDDAKQDPDRLSALGSVDTLGYEERAAAAERATRAERADGISTSIAQTAPDVWLLPAYGYSYSSPYGLRWGRMHNGVDLAAPLGTPVYAVHAGTVIHSGWNGGHGYLVIVDHGNGVETWYAHNSELLVTVGQEVAAGDAISRIGNTGYSFGAHLHFEVHVDGAAVEPVAWMEEHGVDLLSQTEEIYGS